MPSYDYECPNCAESGEFVHRIEEHQICPSCNFVMRKLLTSSHGVGMGASGAYGYYDENLQCYVGSNKQRREEMKKQGVSEAYGKGWY